MRRILFSTFALAGSVILAGPLCAQTAASPSSPTPTLNAATPVGAQPEAQTVAPQAAPPDTLAATPGVSQVRIVRLSESRGEVLLDRNTGHEFEPAFVNIPIIAGERLQTRDGLAEVEFEDNSSLRLTPKTLVEFPVLQRNAAGATETQVKLVSGSAYFSLAGSKGADGMKVTVGSRTITLAPSSHVRLDVAASVAKLTVLSGTAAITDASGATLVTKKKSASLDLNSAASPVLLAHTGEASPFDKWDKTSASYHQARASSAFAGASPYAYGVADLGYYGSFSNLGACGSLWRPYLAGASWEPYQSGVWTLYPGAGYSWVSLYPWGWTPYHSGSWEYCPSGGAGSGSWGWRPSSSWSALRNAPPKGPLRGRAHPVPPAPPAGAPTLVPVNLKSVPVSHVESAQTFTLRADSAGMGVPRNVFGNLGKLSERVAQHGYATTTLSEGQAQRGLITTSAATTRGSGQAAGARGGAAMSSSHSTSTGSSAGSSLGMSSAAAGAAHGASSSAGAPSGGHH